MKLKLPRIGKPYKNANLSWQFARWLIPIALTGWAFHSYLNPPESFGESFEIDPSFITHKFDQEWLIQFTLSLVPTIFLYRIFIALGERFGRNRPRTGALVAVLLVATIPPFIDHLLIKRTLNNLDYVASVPKLNGQTVLLETPHRRLVDCDESCLRLLFSANVERVLVSEDISQTSNLVGFYLENTDGCKVELLSGYSGFRNRKSEFIVIGETGGNWSEISTADRALGQIALGKCIYSKSYKNPDVDVVFRPGVSKADVGFVDSLSTYGIPMPWLTILQEPSAKGGKKVLQLNGSSEAITRINYPTALIYGHRSWISSHYYYKENGKSKSRPQTLYDKLNDLGLSLQQPKYIGWTQTEAALVAALNDKNLPKSDPRLQLARQYIDHGLRSRFGSLDRDTLINIITDLRISGEALRSLHGVGSNAGNRDAASALMRRIIGLPSDSHEELRYASNLVMRDAETSLFSVILPMVRELEDDQEKLKHVSSLFRAYEAGNEDDAIRLLTTYNRTADELAKDSNPGRDSFFKNWRKRYVLRKGIISSSLIGLCALADKSQRIKPALVKSAKANLPKSNWGSFHPQHLIWLTLTGFDVDLKSIAQEAGANAEEMKFVARLEKGRPKKCGSSKATVSKTS